MLDAPRPSIWPCREPTRGLLGGCRGDVSQPRETLSAAAVAADWTATLAEAASSLVPDAPGGGPTSPVLLGPGASPSPPDRPLRDGGRDVPPKDDDADAAAAYAGEPLGVDKAPVGTPPDYSDHEKARADQGSTELTSARDGPLLARLARRHRRVLAHLFVFLLFTGWWIASLVLHRRDRNWIVPLLLWLAISLRLLFYYLPVRHVSAPIRWAWRHSAVVVHDAVPARLRSLVGGLAAAAVILVGSFVSEESADNTRANRAVSLFGMAVIILAFYLTSAARTRINWRTVIVGMLSQYVIGLFVLRTGVGYDIFKFIADRAGDLLGFAKDGVAFLATPDVARTSWFFFGVIPAIIFFISLVQLLYYIGFLQWFIRKFATFVFWALGVSGAEAVVAAATPFIGQGESAMLVHPFVPHMTKAEIHQILTCGFATISGSVLVGYIGLGLNPEALVSSCIMSIPASLAISKLRYPETEETLTAGRVVIPDDDNRAENALHAFANGAWLGIKIGGTIIASLLCTLAAVGLINGLLAWWGCYLDINDPQLTLQTILSYAMYPVAFLLGVPRNGDLLKVAKLIAEKIVTVRCPRRGSDGGGVTDLVFPQNEYNAFTKLAHDPEYANLSARSQLIATYAVCGFGNIGSLGIQIGILGQLASSRGGDVSRLAVSALISGVMSTLTSATVAGLFVTTQLSNFATSGRS